MFSINAVGTPNLTILACFSCAKINSSLGSAVLSNCRNEEIMEELKTQLMVECKDKQRQNSKDHVNSMERRRIPKQILQYLHHGKRSTECLAKRRLKTVTHHMV
jgi:hypothetical protein